MRDPDAYLVARLRFKHLAMVEALGRLHSIRKAAQDIHVSEPAVSKALAEIETSFGFSLFDRSSAGVMPTARGTKVIEGARLLLNSLRQVRLAAANAGERLSLRLGINPFVAQTFLPHLLSAVLREEENVLLELNEGPVPQLLQSVLEGKTDAMLVVMSAENVGSQSASDLTVRPLFAESLKIIAPKGHPLAKLSSVSWSALSQERWILPPATALVHATIRHAFLAQGVLPPLPWMVSAAPRTNVELVGAGLGLSAVPAPFANGARVDVLQVEPQAMLPPVSLVFRTAAVHERSIKVLDMALSSVLAGEAPGPGRKG